MKILIAEDDQTSRRLLQVYLERWGYEVAVCQNGTQAWEQLQKTDTPRLAILDWMMPGKDGVELCREIRQRPGQPYVYVLLLTARNSRDDLIAGLDAGADDYLSKPFDKRELELRLRTGQRILNLQSELIAAREALRVQATHDSLTGLWNRPAIAEALDKELCRAQRQELPLGLILADLDYFKAVNDSYGHHAGDAVLREAAHRMRAALRPYDTLGRYGGEEFLIVAPGCGLGSAVTVAERLRISIASQPIVLPEQNIIASACFGVASFSPGEVVDAGGLIRAADEALYRAKESGRNRVEVTTLADLMTLRTGGGPCSHAGIPTVRDSREL
jgi:two-component system, cell cycle response regulator